MAEGDVTETQSDPVEDPQPPPPRSPIMPTHRTRLEELLNLPEQESF